MANADTILGMHTHGLLHVHVLYVKDIARDRVFYEIYRHEHKVEALRASCHVYCIKHEDFSCYVCVIHDDPLPDVCLLLHGYNLDNGMYSGTPLNGHP